MHHGLGRRLFGGEVGDLGGRCQARASGRGMWDVEGGGGWGSGAWIGEAEQREGGSPARRRRFLPLEHCVGFPQRGRDDATK